jgi:hypothetical protein
MQDNLCVGKRANCVIKEMRQRLIDPGLCARHRRQAVDFSRQCRLTFPVLLLLLLRKSLKSLQMRVHELFRELDPQGDVSSTSAGALTHARAKLCASVFIELNQQAVLPVVYGPEYGALLQRWRGHRLLSVDSSLMRLPTHAAVGERFGWVQCANHRGSLERYPQGRVSVLYDTLNELALEARLEPWVRAETELAQEQLAHVQADDVLLTDRGYTGYGWLVSVRARGAHFISRASRSSFAAVQQLFARNEAGLSRIVSLSAPREMRAQCRERGWPMELTVRLVTVRLASGELEVLITSLLDEEGYPTEEFATIYWRRWKQETYYGRLKGRLDLEHCTGKTVEAVEQDFQATVLLSNVESVVIASAQEQLSGRTTTRQQPAKVNRAVSLHAIKSRLIDLLASPLPTEQVLEELSRWFQANPVSIRSGRLAPRRKPSPSRSYHYQRRVRKIVF